MNAFAYLPADEPLTEAPLFWIEPKDRDPASEDDRQGAFAKAIRSRPGVRIAAILNDHDWGQKLLNRANKLGAKWGFPDTIIYAAGRIAFIEFKNGRRMPEQHQVDCMNDLHRLGFPVAVCRTAAGALAFLRDNGFPVEVRDAA